MSTSTFVTMGRQHATWGIHAQIVRAIVADRAWDGAEPFDISDVLGIDRAPRDDARPPVLVLGSREKPAAVRALSSVVLKQVDVNHVWVVPPLVRSAAKRQTVSAVAFVAGELPLVVLDPIALLAMIEEHAAS